VQWLAAAITVGIGFGLQEIFANFISGLIILFERPIRLGDIVTVGDISGNVSRINIRATTITDFDRREFIVPNKEFITGKLLNWTLTDPVTRVLVPVGIAYGSDVALAEKLLLKIAGENPHVMKDPPPRAIFWSFGDNSLEFRLYVHIPRRNIYLDMLHGLTTAIDREFRHANINIAFPQRDIHFHPAGPLEVQLARKRESRPEAPDIAKPPDNR
jgi:potassium efflux system protein